MASNIISTTIDGAFPVAGVDNDTQGFRDNFTIIKDGLANAKIEIETLQDSTAKKDEDNNFDGSQISGAEFVNNTHAAVTPTNPIELSYASGSYFEISIARDSGDRADADIGLVDWPDTGYAIIRASIRTDGDESDIVVNWTSSVGGGSTIYLDDSWPSPDFQATADRKVVEFWTFNGGTTVYGRYIGVFTESV